MGITEIINLIVNNGIASAKDVVPQLSIFNNREIILSLIGIIITGILVSKKVKNKRKRTGIIFGWCLISFTEIG